MWNTSRYYKDEISQRTIDCTWYGTITLTDGTELKFTRESIDQNKSKITRQYVNGETLEIGNAFSSELVLGLRDSDSLLVSENRYEFYGAVIELTFRLYGDSLQNEDQDTHKMYEDVPCGIYTVDKAEFTYTTVLLTAYDNLHKAHEKTTTSKMTDGTAYAGLTALCTMCGLTLATTEAEIDLMPNGIRTWKLSQFKKGSSVKDIIEAICTCLCANCVADREGNIVIKPYSSTSQREIGDSARYSSNYVDYLGRYTKLALDNKEGDEEVYDCTIVPGEGKLLTLSIGKNVLLNEKSSTVRRACAEEIINELATILYAPLSISIPQDPSIDIGDGLLGSGTHFRNGFLFIDTKDEIPLFGQTKITSAGGDYKLANRKKTAKVEKKISDLEQQQSDMGESMTLIETRISEVSGMINVGYILPVEVHNDNIADGSNSDVLIFEFDVDEVITGEDGTEYSEAVSFYAELCFFIQTTSTEASFGDGILSVTYLLDGDTLSTSAYSYGDGWKILTLNGLLHSLTEGSHRFVVRLAMSGGAIITPS